MGIEMRVCVKSRSESVKVEKVFGCSPKVHVSVQ